MDAAINPEQGVSSLEQILRVSLEEEEEAIRVYTEILESLRPSSNVILFQTIQEILRDEQEHWEELDALQNLPKG